MYVTTKSNVISTEKSRLLCNFMDQNMTHWQENK